jgi:hypothetical protein
VAPPKLLTQTKASVLDQAEEKETNIREMEILKYMAVLRYQGQSFQLQITNMIS